MKDCKGFTLIEVIITIVILAIAAAAAIGYMGTSFTGSAVPAGQVQRQYQLIQRMETITSQYRNAITNDSAFTLANFKTSFIDGTQYVDSTQTGLITMTSGTYTTQSVLRVTLVNGDQTLISIFTQ